MEEERTGRPVLALPYSLGEEIANGVTHGIGAALSVAALSILVTFAGLKGDAWRVVSFSIYGATLVLLYLTSTFYHSFQSPRVKGVFRTLDHSAIFLLIAGTYTPFTLVSLRGPWGWSLFGLVWGLAIAGILLEVFFKGRSKVLALSLYIGMGWLVLIGVKPLVQALPAAGIVWLALGGFAYTFGVVFYVLKRIPFNHAVWHLFVLAGSVCHFFSILLYVLPVEKA